MTFFKYTSNYYKVDDKELMNILINEYYINSEDFYKNNKNFNFGNPANIKLDYMKSTKIKEDAIKWLEHADFKIKYDFTQRVKK